MSKKCIKLIQITDCHLGKDKGQALLSMDPDESLHDVLDLLDNNHPTNDAMIVTGDLVNDPVLPAYQRLHETLSERVTCPFNWLPGNHDAPDVMESFGRDVNAKTKVLGEWVLIMLNSRVEGSTYGYLKDTELTFLATTLEQYTDKHIMICLHHQPVPIGSHWMDNYIVRNAQEFWRIIDQHPQVKMVIWGHVHQQFDDQYNDIALLAAPSTCIQFTPGKRDFEIENSMPGYRWFELHHDGRFSTGVERVPVKDYGIDFQSKGY